MPKVVLINGPKRSGKDTAANVLTKNFHSTYRIGFADHLKRATHAAYGIEGLKFDHFESQKDQPLDLFFGLTPRQAYIAHSEAYMKVFHGKDVFGRIWIRDYERFMATEAKKEGQIFVVPDSGFIEEAEPIIEKFGKENVVLVRIHREGHDFIGDSRSYIYLDDVQSFDVHNNNSQFEFESWFARIFMQWGFAKAI